MKLSNQLGQSGFILRLLPGRVSVVGLTSLPRAVTPAPEDQKDLVSRPCLFLLSCVCASSALCSVVASLITGGSGVDRLVQRKKVSYVQVSWPIADSTFTGQDVAKSMSAVRTPLFLAYYQYYTK
ncbi:hypothetical protein V8F20_002323 [Naviculisporaceae sp. PSN 640]